MTLSDIMPRLRMGSVRKVHPGEDPSDPEAPCDWRPKPAESCKAGRDRATRRNTARLVYRTPEGKRIRHRLQAAARIGVPSPIIAEAA